MDPQKLDNQFCFALCSLSHAVTRLYQPLLKPLGLTYPQYLVMLVLWEESPVRVSEIGEKLHLDSGTLSPLLKKLEKLGLVQRERSAEDERVVLIRLTAKGKKMKDKAKDVPKNLLCLTGQNADALGNLRDELKRIQRNLQPD